jgi:hypothetical protein
VLALISLDASARKPQTSTTRVMIGRNRPQQAPTYVSAHQQTSEFFMGPAIEMQRSTDTRNATNNSRRRSACVETRRMKMWRELTVALAVTGAAWLTPSIVTAAPLAPRGAATSSIIHLIQMGGERCRRVGRECSIREGSSFRRCMVQRGCGEQRGYLSIDRDRDRDRMRDRDGERNRERDRR